MGRCIDIFSGKNIATKDISESLEYEMLKVFNDCFEGLKELK